MWKDGAQLLTRHKRMRCSKHGKPEVGMTTQVLTLWTGEFDDV